MQNPKVAEKVQAAVDEAASQGGTSREGTSESPQRGVTDQDAKVRGGSGKE